jgi:hypothetical protein
MGQNVVDQPRHEFRSGDLIVLFALAFTLLAVFALRPAHALSELKPVEPPVIADESTKTPPPLDGPLTNPDGGLPDPSPIIRQTLPSPAGDDDTDEPDIAEPVEVMTDPTLLPEPAQRMRQLIIDAASSGDPEKLRALFGIGPSATQLSLGEVDADPVDYIRSVSGDGQGQEILAILIDLLNTGFIRVGAGEADETYIWPYFVALTIDELTPPQRVDLLRIVTAGDLDNMKTYGGYNFYRIGISPDGEWRFFLASD